MLKTTVGQLLVNDALPEDLRDYHRKLDKSSVKSLFQAVAEKHPQKYNEILHKLGNVGREAAYRSGGFSFGLKDLVRPPRTAAALAELEQRIAAIQSDASLSEQEVTRKIQHEAFQVRKQIGEQVFEEALAAENPLALQVYSGARGKKDNIQSLLAADFFYQDQRDRVIPFPVLKSYSQGLTPADYWASGYGARKGVFDTKLSTAEAGALAKQLGQAAHRLLVTSRNAGGSPDRGLPVSVDDSDNDGAFLARPVGKYPRNTLLTPKIRSDLKAAGVERILVRSPLVGGSDDGGIDAYDLGVRESGGLSSLGSWVGLAASQAISEPLSQSSLSSKHSGGVAGAAQGVSAFRAIEQLTQVPKNFMAGSVHAQADGAVEGVVPAPAGGHYVEIGGHRHYVPPDRTLSVKKGDVVEAGDMLSDGLPNPAEFTRHKGIGEGRRRFVETLGKVFRDNGLPLHRRNAELLGRGLIDHVRINDSFGEYIPDDVVPYHTIESSYEPRQGAAQLAPDKAVGKYLEAPVLHYSIGSKIRPSVAKELGHFGISQVHVHDEPPPFEAEQIRAMGALQHDPDWMTRMLGQYQERALLKSVHRGHSSDEAGTSYVPALAKGTEFGLKGKTGL